MAIASFEIVGDFVRFEKFMIGAALKGNLEREIRKATIRNSLLVIRTVGKKIRGRGFAENSPLTLALSKGTIPLLKEKNLLDALSFQLRSSFESEVGFLKNTKSTGGVTGSTIGIKKVVELMHTGYTITVTPKMIAAIMAALSGRKTKRGNLTGRAKKALKALKSTQGGRGKTVWRVPPRKFMQEVFEDKDMINEIKKNWNDALERVWKTQGALGGEHKNKGKPGSD